LTISIIYVVKSFNFYKYIKIYSNILKILIINILKYIKIYSDTRFIIFFRSSGTINAEEIDDYEGNLGKGRWIFATSPRADRSPRLQCYDWFIGSSNLAMSTRQCPRFETQALVDRRFRRQDIFGRICYARVFPRSGPGLRCCYRRFGGPLLRNLPEPGGFLSRNPLSFDVGEDDRAFENCCLLSDLCSAYFVQRPKQDGRFYRPRRFGNS
jgi:hypothetical protein